MKNKKRKYEIEMDGPAGEFKLTFRDGFNDPIVQKFKSIDKVTDEINLNCKIEFGLIVKK